MCTLLNGFTLSLLWTHNCDLITVELTAISRVAAHEICNLLLILDKL